MAGAPRLPAERLGAAVAGGEIAPVYAVIGDDEREKAACVDILVGIVPEEDRAFNVVRFHADETSPAAVVASARTLPMLGGRQVVLLMRAERLFAKRRGGASAPEDDADVDEVPSIEGLDLLIDYLEVPEPRSVLVLVASDLNRATRLGRSLVRQAALVECWGLKEDRPGRGSDDRGAGLSRAAALVVAEARGAGLRVSDEAVRAILQHAGLDISRLRGDVERLILYCAGRSEVTIEDVRAVVGGATLLDAWALTRAIEQGAAADALRQLALALEAGAVPYMVLGQLGWFVRNRLAPDRVASAVEAVYQADQALKTSGGDPQVVLERLVVELSGPGRMRPRAGRPR